MPQRWNNCRHRGPWGVPSYSSFQAFASAREVGKPRFEHFNFRVDVLNLFGSKANTCEYVTPFPPSRLVFR